MKLIFKYCVLFLLLAACKAPLKDNSEHFDSTDAVEAINYKYLNVIEQRSFDSIDQLSSKNYLLLDSLSLMINKDYIVNSYKELDSIVATTYWSTTSDTPAFQIAIPSINFSKFSLVVHFYGSSSCCTNFSKKEFELRKDTVNSNYIWLSTTFRVNNCLECPGVIIPIVYLILIPKVEDRFDFKFEKIITTYNNDANKSGNKN